MATRKGRSNPFSIGDITIFKKILRSYPLMSYLQINFVIHQKTKTFSRLITDGETERLGGG